jgi:hypothetical protein
LKGLIHFPFGRGVKKAQLFFFGNRPKGNHLHGGCIKKTVGLATVVDVLQIRGLQHNVLVRSYLHG